MHFIWPLASQNPTYACMFYISLPMCNPFVVLVSCLCLDQALYDTDNKAKRPSHRGTSVLCLCHALRDCYALTRWCHPVRHTWHTPVHGREPVAWGYDRPSASLCFCEKWLGLLRSAQWMQSHRLLRFGINFHLPSLSFLSRWHDVQNLVLVELDIFTFHSNNPNNSILATASASTHPAILY